MGEGWSRGIRIVLLVLSGALVKEAFLLSANSKALSGPCSYVTR